MNQDLALTLALPVTLFCIMFGMGATLSLEDFRRLVRTPRAIACGVSSQMILLPLLALLTVSLFDLPPAIAVGFMILAFSPGAVPVHAVEELQSTAELGVVLFVFTVGLEMRPEKVWFMRLLIFGLGSAQMLVTGRHNRLSRCSTVLGQEL